jgi:hypothetical protein
VLKFDNGVQRVIDVEGNSVFQIIRRDGRHKDSF